MYKIICPNCGAENEYGGNCQYCGGSLANVDREASISEELDGGPQYVKDDYKFLVQTYDKFDKLTEIKVHGFFLGGSDISLIKKCYPWKSEFCLRVSVKKLPCTLELLIDNNKTIRISQYNKVRAANGMCDYIISQNSLFELCQSHVIEGRMVYIDSVNTIDTRNFIYNACLFYNRLIDNSQFKEIYNKAFQKNSVTFPSQIASKKLDYELDYEWHDVLRSKLSFKFSFIRKIDGSDYVEIGIDHAFHLKVDSLYIDNFEIKFDEDSVRYGEYSDYLNIEVLLLMCKAEKICIHLFAIDSSCRFDLTKTYIVNITKSINYWAIYWAIYNYYLKIVESINNNSEFIADWNETIEGNYKSQGLKIYYDKKDDIFEDLKEAIKEKEDFIKSIKEEDIKNSIEIKYEEDYQKEKEQEELEQISLEERRRRNKTIKERAGRVTISCFVLFIFFCFSSLYLHNTGCSTMWIYGISTLLILSFFGAIVSFEIYNIYDKTN